MPVFEALCEKDVAMNKVHKCNLMEKAEVWVEIDEDEALLNLNNVASEQDLEENHYLEEVGQTKEHVILNILFCPYCGEKVKEGNSEFIPVFTHNDFSKW